MNWGRAPGVLLGGGVSLVLPLPVLKSHRASAAERRSCPKFKFQWRFSTWCRKGRAEARCLTQKAPRVQFPGAVVGTLTPPSPLLQATLLLSFLWMPALLPVASRLLLLPRALLSMASGSPPSQPSPASGSGYVPGSVSAAFVTCPNEKVAKEIARWGPRPDDLEGVLGIREGRCLWDARTTPGRARSHLASPSGQWWRSAWQPASTSSRRSHPCELSET